MQRIFQSIICLCLAFSLSAQGSQFDTTMVLSASSATKSVPVQVKSGADEISFQIEGEISTGSIVVKIYDPNGKKQSGLQLRTSEDNTTSKSKTKIRSKGPKGKGAAAQQEGSGASEIRISSGETTTTVSSGSGANTNRNSNSNSNSNTDDGTTVTVSTGSSTTQVGSGGSGDGSYSYVSSSSLSGAKGVLQESVNDPMPGRWRVEIVTENVTGEVKLKVSQK